MKPRAFISSTFYELKQVRARLTDVLTALRFEVLNSTEPSFFANPIHNTVENCETNVRACDIMILIIGGRYGGIVTEEGRSITNLEYLWAPQQNIPILTFVERDVWVLYENWVDNGKPTPRTRASKIDQRVFPFIESVSKSDKSNWIWYFDHASTIEEVIQNQFSSLILLQLQSFRKGFTTVGAIDRLHVTAQYSTLISSSVSTVDIVGVSLITLTRSTRIDKAFAGLSSKVNVRVLILDPASEAARLRAAEEYGSSNLIAELEASKAIWANLRSKYRSLSVRCYSRFPRVFYFRIDSKAFLSFYPLEESSVNVPTFEVSDGGILERMNRSYFEPLWKEGVSI